MIAPDSLPVPTSRALALPWAPPKKLMETTAFNEARAQRVWQVVDFYHALCAEGSSKQRANELARRHWEELAAAWKRSEDWRSGFADLPAQVNECTLRRCLKRVEAAGGHGTAPLEAYGHFKSTAHPANRADRRLARQLAMDEEQLAKVAAVIRGYAVECEHASAVYHQLQIEWRNQREIPGLGVRRNGALFPLTMKQVRAMMPSTAARRLGSHGGARFLRIMPRGCIRTWRRCDRAS
jgi:hypothetical protein